MIIYCVFSTSSVVEFRHFFSFFNYPVSYILENSNSHCPKLSINSGSILHTGDDVGDTAYYNCIEGKELSGLPLRKCQEDGEWSGLEPKCQGGYKPFHILSHLFFLTFLAYIT